LPKKTAAPIELTYNDQADNPPNLEAVTKPLAEEVRQYLLAIGLDQLVVPGGAADKGKLVVVDNTGVAAFQAMKGDATLAPDGTLAIGEKKIFTQMLGDEVVTTAKQANKSVTLAKLADEVQMVLAGERVPIDGSVTLAKLADGAVTSRKAKLTAGVKQASGDLTLGELHADVPGTELNITPAVPSVLRIMAVFDFQIRAEAGEVWGIAEGTVQLDEVDQTPVARFVTPSTSLGSEATVAQVYHLPLTVAAHVVKLRAKRGVVKNGKALKANTQMTYELFAS
jgi:hypothetical protein